MREDYERWKSEKKGREKKKKNSTFSSIFCYQSLSDNFGVFVGHVVFITKNCRAYMTNLLSINKIRVLQKKKKKSMSVGHHQQNWRTLTKSVWQ
jgi:hypothetical protein